MAGRDEIPADKNTEELYKDVVSQAPEWFEESIVWYALFNKSVFATLNQVVCRTENNSWCSDFLNPICEVLYRAAKIAREMASPNDPEQLGKSIILSALHASTADFRAATQSDVLAAMRLYDSLAADDRAQVEKTVRGGLRTWLLSRRSSKLAVSHMANRASTAAGMLTKLSSDVRFITSATGTTRHMLEGSAGLFMTPSAGATDIMPTGLFRLDYRMGGGIARKESALVIAAPGVGKTVFALQLAIESSLRGRLVVFITTEQPFEELRPRIIANKCNYDFAKISHGVDIHQLPDPYKIAAYKLAASLKNRFYCFDWNQDPTSIEGGGIEHEMDLAEKAAGRPVDLVVLDWLGGALTKDCQNDKDKKRLALQIAADRMATIAKERDTRTVAMAQANKKSGLNNRYVDIGCVPENHTLDQAMTLVLGLSGMYSKEARVAIQQGGDYGSYDLFDIDQSVFISKARKGVGGHVPIKRNFKYQRFECE